MQTLFLRLAAALACLVSVASCTGIPEKRAPISDREIEAVVARAMQEYRVPGMAVGVVLDGEILIARGFGVRDIGTSEPVDIETMFRIASASKAFTSAALAILVDEGKVSWDGPVAGYLPEFRMNDDWVTERITVSDLLAHRSGLSPHAGDLLLWPVPNEHTTADVIHALRYFPLESGFRNGYSYDNLLYIVAGEVVASVSGQAWGDFVDHRIMRPLGMERCVAGRVPDSEMTNLAAPHGVVEGELTVIERNRIPAEPTKFAPAGGIVCSLSDMLTWVGVQLGQGMSQDGVELFSAAQSREMWSPHNWLGVSDLAFDWYRTQFSAYGLGWRMRDIQGYREVSHTGSLDGMRAHVLMIPELGLGIVVLANGSSSDARNAVMRTIEHAFLGRGQRDWIAAQQALDEQARAERAAVEEEEHPAEAPLPRAHRPLEQYFGLYRDPWFGEARVSLEGDTLYFSAAKSPNLGGPMEHVDGDTFVARWLDRSMEMDAFIHFEFDGNGSAASMRMNRTFETPGATIDHFEYLDFKRVE